MTSHPLEGVPRFIRVVVASSGAGATTVPLRPPAGKLWEVLFAIGQQDDGAVALSWGYTDPDTVENLASITSAGAGIPWAFGSLSDAVATASAHLYGPIVLTYDRYLRYVFTASAGSKTGVVTAIVKEFRGVALEV